MGQASSAIGGGLSGAASGAAIGSVVPGIGTAIGAIGGGLVGAIGGLLSGGGDDDAMKEYQLKALQAIAQIPDPKLQQIELERYQTTGSFSPQIENVVHQQTSQMSNIKSDPRLAQAQMGALSKLQGIGNTGLDATDRAALGQIQQQGDVNNHAQQQSILQEMQQRGQGGGGAELAAKLSAQQGAANQSATQSNNVAAQAQQRALAAIMQSGQLSGQMQQQQFGQQADVARAQDAIAQFNAQNAQAVNARNTATANQGQQYNLNNAQNIANQNVGVGNQQTMYNYSQLPQQQFNNSMAKGTAQAGAYNTAAGQSQQAAQNGAQTFGGIMQGAGTAAGGIAQYLGKAKTGTANPSPAPDAGGGSGVDAFGNPKVPKEKENLGF